MLDVRMFGSIEVVDGDRVMGARAFGCLKAKQVFEILLVERGSSVSKERLADSLWGERLPQRYVATVESYVSVLRSRLEPGRGGRRSVVVTEPAAYRLSTDLVRLDLDVFDALVARADVEGPERALELLCEAADLVRGEVLADEPYAEWIQELRERYRRTVTQVLVRAAQLASELGDAGRAVGLAERAIRVDAVAEAAYRVLMLASYRLGRQEDAVRAFERCRKALASELGVEPMAETAELYAAIQAHESSLGRSHDRRDPNAPSVTPPVSLISPSVSSIPSVSPALATPVGLGRGVGGLLGRAAQLAELNGRVQAALAGRFSLVLVDGDAGVGSSRLVDELTSGLVGVRTVRWRCSQLETGFAFLVIASALRGLDTGSADASLLGEPGPAEALSLLDGLAAQIQRHAPFVLVIDRLDLADPASVSALGYLARRLADTPVAVVATCRTPAALRTPISQLEWTTRIRLERLTEDDLVDYQVPDLHALTGGHPVFVAAHVGQGPGIDAAVDLADYVLAWCGDAGDTALRTLSAASVMGQPFDPAVLAQVLGIDAVAVAEDLDRLCQHGLLREQGQQFTFRDDLVRQILEDNLSPGRRALLVALAKRALSDPAEIHTTRYNRQARLDPTELDQIVQLEAS